MTFGCLQCSGASYVRHVCSRWRVIERFVDLLTVRRWEWVQRNKRERTKQFDRSAVKWGGGSGNAAANNWLGVSDCSETAGRYVWSVCQTPAQTIEPSTATREREREPSGASIWGVRGWTLAAGRLRCSSVELTPCHPRWLRWMAVSIMDHVTHASPWLYSLVCELGRFNSS